jgi:multicomponent Na+:H+ antiporter subunit G
MFLLMVPVFYRVIVGPTSIDRVVAINMIGTKTAVLLIVIGQIFGRVDMFVDFALAYALLNFIGSIADMISLALSGLSVICISIGLLFFLGAAVGLIRFPDFYTRMHAAGKGDTLSTLLIMVGIICYILARADFSDVGDAVATGVVVLKIMGIGAFIMFTSPTSTHALMKAGYEDGIKPFKRGGHGDEAKGGDDAP